MLFINKFTRSKYNLTRTNCLVTFKLNMKIISLEKDFESELFLTAP